MNGLEQLVGNAACLGARMSGALLFVPFLGNAAIPVRIKACLAVALTVLLYPVYESQVPVIHDAGQFVAVLAGEVVIGLLIGLGANLIFEALQLAGQAIGFQMGFSLVNIIDPQTQVDTPVMGVFHQTIGLLIFLQLNIHHALLRGIARSLEFIPPGGFLLDRLAVVGLLKLTGMIWVLGLRIAAPVLIATVVTDLALGFLSKASPSFPALVVGLSVKTILGLVVLSAALVLLPNLLDRHCEVALRWTEGLLHLR